MKIRNIIFQSTAFTLIVLVLAGCSAGGRSEAHPTVNPALETNARPEATPTVESTAPRQVTSTLSGPAYRNAALSTASAVIPAAGGLSPTFGAVIGPEQTAQPTATLSPTPPPTLQPLATDVGPTPAFGAVVGPNYTPPPTITPWPSPTLARGVLPPPVTPGPSLTPGPILRADLMGIQVYAFLTDAQFSTMLDYAKELGVDWIKLQIDWALYEPQKGQFSEFYQAAVLNVQRASIRGFKTMLSFDNAPDWARPEAVRGVEGGPPDNPQDLAAFVGRFVSDAKPEFIDAIEIWNEPNLIREWRGKPINGGVYMAYFRAAYEAILSAQQVQRSALKPNHRIMVITAGPAPTITLSDGSTEGDQAWLQELYDSGLASFGPDVALGAHPYGWGNAPGAKCCQAAQGITGWFEHPSFYFRETLDAYRAIMLRNNHTAGKIWVTEFGWASYEGLQRSDGYPAKVNGDSAWENLLNQQQQADYVLGAFRLAQQTPYYDFLGPMMLWNLNYSMIPTLVDKGGEQAGFSLLDSGGKPRPVFAALRDVQKQ
jgi:hypothetical protein